MKTPDVVAEKLRQRACGWGLKRIARQLCCSHHTVKDYVAAGGVKAFKSPERPVAGLPKAARSPANSFE
ncbi:hypothetical protein [Bradyrhizobium sp. CCGUVB23]|uniref:hypothetical protein n=1 Tax=Bradyrhizobium sp. CCGUVB23 TaxID=2949630 RepID=UPI0020B44FE9|nr:hypothetical protein [Bradyrhizobium sp. CCGUVB23]MCP3460551.1 hypothetical protein [Bradyrhizobium sp. CCGUVB23]